MTTTIWKAGASGDWSNAADWSSGVPSATSTATIAGAGSFLVTLYGSGTVGTLLMSAPGAQFYDAGTLFLAGTLALQSGTLTLAYGDITGGTIALNGGLFQSQGGTLSGVTIQGQLNLADPESSLVVTGGLTLLGANGTGSGMLSLTGAYSALDVSGSQTLDRATILIGASGSQPGQQGAASLGITQGDAATTAATLTLGPNLWLRGAAGQGAITLGGPATGTPNLPSTLLNEGTITAAVAGESLAIRGAGAFVNQGTIAVSNSATLQLNTSQFTNTGTILVSNATLSLAGTIQSALLSNLGAITIGAGDLRIDGTLINAGTLALGTGSALGAKFGAIALAGTITGGTITDGGGGLSFRAGTGVLNATAYDSTLNLAAGATLTLMGNAVLRSATGGVGSVNCTGSGAALLLRGTENLDNVNISLGSAGSAAIIATTDVWLASTATTATLGANAHLVQTGANAGLEALGWSAVPGLGLADTLVNQGQITAAYAGGQFVLGGYGTFLNQGSITVSANDTLSVTVSQFANAGLLTAATGGTILLGQPATWMGAASTWSNAGQIAINGGTLVLGGAFTTAQLGTITQAAGTAILAGTLSNTGNTLTLGGTGALRLPTLSLSGTITGGTIIDSAGALAATTGGSALLSGVNYQGTLTLGAGAFLGIRNGLALTGIVNLTGAGSTLDFQGSQSFIHAHIYLGATSQGPSSPGSSGQGSSGQGATLAVSSLPGQSSGATLTLGSFCAITQSGKFATIGQAGGQAGSPAGGTIVNRGNITAAVPGGTLALTGLAFINQGVLTAGPGETLAIDSTAFANTGAININGGTLSLGGSLTLAQLGHVSLSNGAFSVAGTLDLGGGTLTLGRGSPLTRLGLTGTLANGTILDTGVGLAPTGGATLNAVTYRGTLDLSRPFATLAIANGITLSNPVSGQPGQILLTGAQSRLLATTAETIDAAHITLGSPTQSYNGQTLAAPELAATPGVALTLGRATTLTLAGTAGTLGDAGLGQWADSIINLGQILAALPGTLTLGATFFTNSGTIAASAGGTINIADTGFTNAGLLTVTTGASLQLSLYDFYAAPNAPIFQCNNTGTIALLGGTLAEQTGGGLFPPAAIANRAGAAITGHGILGAQVANAGHIEAQGGTLLLTQAISGTGTIFIDPSATLDLTASVAATQTVDFTSLGPSPGGTLTLANPVTFAAKLQNLGAADAIDLPGQTLTSLSLTTGTLTLATTAQTYHIAATAALAGALSASHDAQGGAVIHYTPQGGGQGAGPTTTLLATQSNMLFWAAPQGDLFSGTAALLTGASIANWSVTDNIDITDLTTGQLTVSQTAGITTLTIANATHTTSVGLTGTFAANLFHVASDGHGGTLLTFT